MRNNYSKRHFIGTPFRFVMQHLGPNRAQRRAAGYRDGKGRLVVEPSSNHTYTKG